MRRGDMHAYSRRCRRPCACAFDRPADRPRRRDAALLASRTRPGRRDWRPRGEDQLRPALRARVAAAAILAMGRKADLGQPVAGVAAEFLGQPGTASGAGRHLGVQVAPSISAQLAVASPPMPCMAIKAGEPNEQAHPCRGRAGSGAIDRSAGGHRLGGTCAKDRRILRPVRLRPHSGRTAPSGMGLATVGPRLSARLPSRLLLCLPARSVGLCAMRLLALPEMVVSFRPAGFRRSARRG